MNAERSILASATSTLELSLPQSWHQIAESSPSRFRASLRFHQSTNIHDLISLPHSPQLRPFSQHPRRTFVKMSEYIGSRISLISKSDIKYIGTLHEINSDNHTVALESVTSHGTEGRKGNPAEEVPGSDQIYEYIVFRGSDVKDLTIIEQASQKENQAPQVPNDPAILGVSGYCEDTFDPQEFYDEAYLDTKHFSPSECANPCR